VTDDATEAAHGRIDLRRALVESCNVYFAWLGTKLGAGDLFEFARKRLGFELKGVEEAQDLEADLPDNAYGQAKITVSPLRLGTLAAAVANGGFRVDPGLIRPRGNPIPVRMRVFSTTTASTLVRWMQEVVQSGTGRRVAVPGLVVGGETGTAQNEIGDKIAHSWFMGFAFPGSRGPAGAIAFAFLIENGGDGGRAAAQAAHDFLAECYPVEPGEIPKGRRMDPP
jgi:peptidoglycan glycosyltransferase